MFTCNFLPGLYGSGTENMVQLLYYTVYVNLRDEKMRKRSRLNHPSISLNAISRPPYLERTVYIHRKKLKLLMFGTLLY